MQGTRWYASLYWNNGGKIYPYCGSDSYMEMDGRLSKHNAHIAVQEAIALRKKWMSGDMVGYTLSRSSRLRHHFEKEDSLPIYTTTGILTSKKPGDTVL